MIFFRPVPHGLGTVHLPLEHGQRLEGEGEVEDWSAATVRARQRFRCNNLLPRVNWLIISVEVPIVVNPEYGFVVLK